ncbi:MAG: C39 family peptidase [Patescibacteria group bacterium]
MRSNNKQFKKYKLFFILIILAFFWFLAGQAALADCCLCNSVRLQDCFCRDYQPSITATCTCPSTDYDLETWDKGGCKDWPSCHASTCKIISEEDYNQPSKEDIKEGEKIIENEITVPKLQVQIPGFQGFTSDKSKIVSEENGQKSYSFPWIGEYLIALYKWAIRLIAALAVVMIMWAGVEWMVAGGNSSQISDAKERIRGSLFGLVLLLGISTFLSFINPELTFFKPIQLGVIKTVELDGELSDTGAADQSSSGIYFKQCDSSWGNMAYTQGGADCNVCSSGCGPTSVAIALANLGKGITPKDIAQYAIEIGARNNCSNGTNVASLAPAAATKWGVNSKTITTIDDAITELRQGHFLITSIRAVPIGNQCTNSKIFPCGGCFCNGHYVILSGINGNNIDIIDPSRRNLTTLPIDKLSSTYNNGGYLSRIQFFYLWK